jgi:hypothetical protein
LYALIWIQVSRNLLCQPQYSPYLGISAVPRGSGQFCHLLNHVTMGLSPSQPWHSLRCLNFPTSENLLPSILVTCGSHPSPLATPRPTASTTHSTEGAQAGEDFPARHHWPGFCQLSQGEEERHSEELGNERDTEEPSAHFCALQVSCLPCPAQDTTLFAH